MFLKRIRIASFTAMVAILVSVGSAFAQPLIAQADHQSNDISAALNCPDSDLLDRVVIPSNRLDYDLLSQFANCTVVSSASILIPATGTRTNPMTGYGLQERLAAAADQRNAVQAVTANKSVQSESISGWGTEELQTAVAERNKILSDPYADPEFLRFKMRQIEAK